MCRNRWKFNCFQASARLCEQSAYLSDFSHWPAAVGSVAELGRFLTLDEQSLKVTRSFEGTAILRDRPEWRKSAGAQFWRKPLTFPRG